MGVTIMMGFDVMEKLVAANQAGMEQLLAEQGSTKTKNPKKKTIPNPAPVPAEEPQVVEVVAIKEEKVVSVMEGNTRVVASTGTSGSAREAQMYRELSEKPGARHSKVSHIDFKDQHGRLMRKTLPSTDKDLRPLAGNSSQSALAAYEWIRADMESRGYVLMIDPKGSPLCSGHIVYHRKKPSPIKGVTFPAKFEVLEPVTPKQFPDITAVIHDLIQKAGDTAEQYLSLGKGEEMETGCGNTVYKNNGENEEEDPEKYKKLLQAALYKVWSGFELFNKTALQCGLTMASERQNYQRPVNVDGNPIAASRFVPQLEWFDEKLQEVENEQLLSLIPDAEREVMMLFLGRIMMGRQGTPFTNGGEQDLKWRSLVCFEGPQAGMGRTTLLDYLSQGLKICGYNAEAIDDLTGRFGHGRSATADFGFIDDLDPEGTIRTVSSALLKTLASGGTLKVEEKGQMSYQVTAMGAYMVCTNQLDLAKLATLDSGNLSRLMPMRNATSSDRRAKEYKARYGVEINTDLTYEALSEKYQVPIETLVLLLLARSAAKFKEVMARGQRHLVTTLETLKKTFIINTDMDYIDQMFNHYSQIMAVQSDDGSAPKLFEIHKYLTSLIKLQGTESIPGCSDSPDLILEYARSALGSKKRGAATVIREFMSVLSSEYGLGYISDHGKLLQLYRQKQEHFDTSPIAMAIKRGTWEKDQVTQEDRHWLDLRAKLKTGG